MSRGARRGAGTTTTTAALVAGLLVLVGCSGIGSGTSVQPGLQVQGEEVQPVRAFFPGPAKDATQDQIVRGFVRAGAASDGDYETARRFLTEDGVKSWSPESVVVLYAASTPLVVTPRAPNAVVLSGPVEATIGRDGRYVAAPATALGQAVFEFARIEGQWRISNVPKDFGRWLTTSDLDRLLQPYSLYYIAGDRRALVPDRRWFPRDHLATRLARAQLGAPPAYLAGAVRNSIPGGSRLTADSVSVTNGVARVEITGPVPTDRTQREDVWAQLVSTLLQDPTVQAVSIRIGDVTLELPDVDLPVRTIDQVNFPNFPQVPPGRPVIRRGDVLYLLPSASTVETDPRRSDLTNITPDFRFLALSADGTDVAAVDPDGQGISRFRGTNRYDMPFIGTKVGHPAYDVRGYLWAGAAGLEDRSEVRLWAFNTAGDPAVDRPPATPVAAPWLAKRRVVESRPSLQGDRVAILHTAQDGTGAQVSVAGVTRGPEGAPLRLSEPLRLGPSLVGPTGLVWVSDLSVATIARRAGADERPRPYLLSIDGEEQALAETPTGVSITTPGGERDLVVTTSAGTVLRRAGQQWLSLGEGTDVAVPAR